MASDIIYIDNDSLVFLDGLVDKDGAFINNGTVTVTLQKLDGSAVGGVSWPLALPYVAGSNGKYEETIDKAVAVALNTEYKLKFVVVVNVIGDGVFWKDLSARRRVIS